MWKQLVEVAESVDRVQLGPDHIQMERVRDADCCRVRDADGGHVRDEDVRIQDADDRVWNADGGQGGINPSRTRPAAALGKNQTGLARS